MKAIATLGLLMTACATGAPGTGEKRLLYVALPGVRNYMEWGGKGVLVYDIDAGHKLLRRIPSPFDDPGGKIENIKGVAASAATRKLYVSTIRRLACIDLLTEKADWVKAYEGGCDRMSLSADGRFVYLPSLEGPHWNIVDGATGDVVKKLVTNQGAHNTVGLRHIYLAGLRSTMLNVVDPAKQEVVRAAGPFSAAIRPYTVNGSETRCYVNVNSLLGFEVGDLTTGKMLHRVEVPGYAQGPVKRHGCPSHGVGLTPDEKEVWLVDAANQSVHVFDNSVQPPKYSASVKLQVDQPGWITFTIRGDYAYPSTGEIIDPKTRKIVAALKDENGNQVQSEKLLEIDWAGGLPVRNGDQFGVGRVTR